jgi:deazaflavin-dependent oxidoreductase (nitroreductase family)
MSAKESLRFTSFGRPWMILVRGRAGMAFDRWLVRWTGLSVVSLQYSLAGRYKYQPTLLLTTIGKVSGELRSVALPYIRHGDDYVVVASKGGGPVNPAWVGNIVANERCWMRVKRRSLPARAHVARDAERAELYPYVVERKPNVARYQERATGFGREIPLVVLSPTSTARKEPR